MTSLVAPNAAAATANQPTPPTPPSCNAPHGLKRAADSALEHHEQRLSKRFDLLSLDANNNPTATRLYIPVPGSTDGVGASHPPSAPVPTPDPLAFVSSRKPPTAAALASPSSDTMDVEDTPHRVYIHSLDAELADIESDEDTPIFLADIEKHLAKIPTHLLRAPEPKPTQHNQVVLYNVPQSLTVERERDGVRMAIAEARQRLRERQGISPLPQCIPPPPTNMGLAMADADAMDID